MHPVRRADTLALPEQRATSSRAFLYTGGQMLDLNDLIDPSSPLRPYVILHGGEKDH
jgi:hypothetical protein